MAIKTYTKGTAEKLSTNFKSTEFDCHGSGCCSSTLIDEDLVKYLQQIRNHFKKAVHVSSAYRCEKHNKNVGGVTGSRHKKGQAADIYINGITPAEIAKYAESIGILGIGLYETDKDGHFVHIDTRTTKSFWYGQAQEKRTTFGGKTTTKIELPKEGGNGKMKYNENNKPLVCMQTQSTCYQGTGKMTVKGVLWHSTGANNPTLKRYVQPSDDAPDRDAWLELLGVNKYNNDWNHITRQAGLNCWIGKLADGTVATVQTMPWDYRPWGCGSGSKGSCNNGWIQFEICEDDLTNKEYFDKVYQEACEITAYLCKMFNLDPNGTVDYNGIEVPVILCHADSYDLKLGSNHGDVNHWFPKFGKSMETARADVATLLNPTTTEIQYYRVRKSWNDAASQKGAYTNLDNAKKKVDSLGSGYYVFDNNGTILYPITTPEKVTSNGLKEGDEVMLVSGATYSNGTAIPSWVFKKKLYVREVQKDDKVVFSTLATGAITGVTASINLKPYENVSTKEEISNNDFKVGDEVQLIAGATYTSGQAIPTWVFKKKLYIRALRNNGDAIISTLQTGAITGVVNKKYFKHYHQSSGYKIVVNVGLLNVREGASLSDKVVAQIKRGTVHTVTEEKGKWGRIEQGWIYLPHVKKL